MSRGLNEGERAEAWEDIVLRGDVKIDFQSYFAGSDLASLTAAEVKEEPLLEALKLSKNLSVDTRVRFYGAVLHELRQRRNDSITAWHLAEYQAKDAKDRGDQEAYGRARKTYVEENERNTRCVFAFSHYEDAYRQLREELSPGRTTERTRGGRPANDTTPAPPTHKIRWTGTQNQLDLLFTELENEGLLHEDTTATWAATIEDCFLDKAGKPFKAETMRAVRANPNNVAKGQKAKAIEDVVKRVSKESH